MKGIIYKVMLIVLLVNISYVTIYAQITDKDIIGTWQWQNADIASGYNDLYSFHQDGSFCFKTNEFDGTRRILSFGGTYHINDNILVLKIIYSKEIQGGIIERDEIVGGSGWIINNGKIINKKYRHPSVCNLKIEKNYDTKEEGRNHCILIDKQEFYKIEDSEK